LPLLNPFDLVAAFVLHACWKWTTGEAEANQPEETPNKPQLWFDKFPVRPEYRAQRGVSKGGTGNTDETTSHLTKPLKRQVIGYHHERTYSGFADSFHEPVRLGCYLGAFLWLTTLAARLAHYWGDVPFQIDLLMHSYLMHAILSLIWTVTSISLMIYATQHSRRSVWFAGFSLLAIVGVKLMMIDLANKGTVMWTASLIGIALLVIAASYFSPAPPKHSAEVAAE
jgi:hypothetical protein